MATILQKIQKQFRIARGKRNAKKLWAHHTHTSDIERRLDTAERALFFSEPSTNKAALRNEIFEIYAELDRKGVTL